MIRGGVLWVHVGAPRHGVHRFGALLAAATPDRRSRLQVRVPDVSAGPDRVAAASRAHHPRAIVLQFTDRLWGADPEAAATRFHAVAQAAGSLPVVVGLHDLPTTDDPRRGAASRAVAGQADSVVVCSEHERRRLREIGAGAATVIPHPVEDRRAGARAGGRRGDSDVAVLGFLYPGKGQQDVIEAAGRCRSGPAVLLLGGAAPGHEDLASSLAVEASRAGVRMRTTGWVSEPVLVARARRAAVPVVPNCAPSASGSLASWLAVGRRPLVRESEYAREIDELIPGAVELYPGADPEALACRLDWAIARPGSTVAPRVPDRLRPEAIAARWVRLVDRGLR